MVNTFCNDIFYNYLKYFDLYGINFPLHYKTRPTYSTNIGIILSIISIFLAIFFCIYFSIDFLNRNKYSIFINYSNLEHENIFYLNSKNVMFGIFDKNGKFIDNNDIYDISASSTIHLFKNDSSNNNFLTNELKIKKCNYTDIENYNKKYYENLTKEEYEKYYCFEKNQNLSIYGKDGDSFHDFKVISIFIVVNDNFIEKNEEEEVNFLIVNYLKETVDHNKISSPIKTFLNSELFHISNEYSKQFNLYFSLNEYISDNGIFFTHNNFYKFIEADKINFDINKKTNRLLSLTFTTSENKILYKREYIRVQNVISNIGGCINALYLIFKIITKYFARKSLTMDITKTLVCDNCKKICKQHLSKNKKLTYFPKSNYNLLLKLNLEKRRNSFDKNSPQKMKNYFQKFKKKKSLNVPIHIFQSNDFEKINDINNKNNIIRKNSEITNERLKILLQKIKQFPDNKKQMFEFKLYDYLLPIFCLKKFHRFSLLNVYNEIFNSFLSIEQIIPVIENFSKMCSESASIGILMRGVSSFHIFNQMYEKKKTLSNNKTINVNKNINNNSDNNMDNNNNNKNNKKKVKKVNFNITKEFDDNNNNLENSLQKLIINNKN